MAKQFWIDEFFVDTSRNQINKGDQTKPLAPKALAVLTYLAEHPRQVVTYDELLSHVWPDTVVTPNNLQRSIAQLRKALGEDSKQQALIRTHAKQGYSLDCDVRWQPGASLSASLATEAAPNVATEPASDSRQKASNGPPSPPSPAAPQSKRGGPRLRAAAAVFLLLVVASLAFFREPASSMLTVDRIQALTATDDKEHAGTYTPDGKYILFHRYQDKVCFNHIWAKNTETLEETRLTKFAGTYSRHSLSSDGRRLVFVKSQDCREPVTQPTCFSLLQLDFRKALQAPQAPIELMRCKHAAIRSPTWIDANNIALLRKSSDRWQLIRYSINDHTSEILYQPNDGNLVTFDFSAAKRLIALTGVDGRDLPVITMLDADGKQLSSYPIRYPTEIPKYRRVYPSFDPLHDRLVFSAARRLFSLSYRGQVEKLSSPFDEGVGSPHFHPSGRKMLVIKGRYDSDVMSVPLQGVANTNASIQWDDGKATVIARSIDGEDYAAFQPKGTHLAFASQRSGSDQVWLAKGDSIKKLSQFPPGRRIGGLRWSENGRRLLIHLDETLVDLSLTGASRAYDIGHPIVQLFAWDSASNTALANASINGVIRFAEVNLREASIKVVHNTRVAWATRGPTGHAVYMDNLYRFWQSGAAEDELIEALIGEGSSKRFVVHEDMLYGVNRDNRLWSFDLKSRELRRLATLPLGLDYLTDANERHLLVSVQVAAKKEVVELSFK